MVTTPDAYLAQNRKKKRPKKIKAKRRGRGPKRESSTYKQIIGKMSKQGRRLSSGRPKPKRASTPSAKRAIQSRKRRGNIKLSDMYVNKQGSLSSQVRSNKTVGADGRKRMTTSQEVSARRQNARRNRASAKTAAANKYHKTKHRKGY